MTDIQEESLLSRRPDLFSIRLINNENQDVVYIEDGRQIITLEVKNTIEETMELLTDSVSSYTFALEFRPGIIKYSDKNPPTLIQENDGKGFSFLVERKGDGSVVFYFTCKKVFGNPYNFQPQQTIRLPIGNIVFDGTGGTRSSSALFEFQNISYKTNGELIKSERILNFNIVDHRGKKQIPIYAYCPNGNIILNNGTSNNVTIRLTNIFDKDILFSADTSKKSELRVVFEKDIFTTQPNIKAPSNWSAILEEQAEFYSYTLSPDNKDFVLRGKTYEDALFVQNGYLDLEVSDLITTNATKETYVSIRYQNIQNYAAGEIIISIKIQPLIYHGNNVGIGIRDIEDQALYVGGDVTVKNKLTICQKLEVQGDTSVKASLDVKEALSADRYVGRGQVSLYSYDGQGKSGTSYIMAHDSAKGVKLGMVLRVQPSTDTFVNAVQIDSSGKVVVEEDLKTNASLLYDKDFVGRGYLFLYPYEGKGKSGTVYIQARDDGTNVGIGMNLRVQKKGANERELIDALRIDDSGNVVVSTSFSIDNGKGKSSKSMNKDEWSALKEIASIKANLQYISSIKQKLSTIVSIEAKLQKLASSKILEDIASYKPIRIEASGSPRSLVLDNPNHAAGAATFGDRRTHTTEMKLLSLK